MVVGIELSLHSWKNENPAVIESGYMAAENASNIVLGMCNASHGRFLLLCPVLVNIKGGFVLVESVLEVSNSSQDEPNHPCCCFPWQRCVSFIVCSFLKLLAKSRD